MDSNQWVFLILFSIPVLVSLINPKIEMEDMDFSVFLQKDETRSVSAAYHDLEYDFYRQTCPQAETIVRSAVARIYTQHNDVYAGLLRLFFHDCFIHGCDASILLDDSNGNKSYSIEKQAIPSQTLRDMDTIDLIKEEIENACPGVVSCADTLALATRDGIVLAGGPFYPVFTGRRDSAQSYYDEAMAEIPKPTDNISRILDLFTHRGFDQRETVSLIGGHNVGRISCDFIRERLYNFSGTGLPDPSMASDFLNQMRLSCQENEKSIRDGVNSTKEMQFSRGLSISIPSGEAFDAHYYRNLLRGRGRLFADQQLMADENTARFVRFYASDDGTIFRRDFAKGMVKMSYLGVLTGTQGQVRTKCS